MKFSIKRSAVCSDNNAAAGICRAGIGLLLLAAVVLGPSRASAAVEDAKGIAEIKDNSTYDFVVEKNLFSPDRKKWVSAPAGKQSEKAVKKELNDLMLLGTVIGPKGRYAVLSPIQKNPKQKNDLQPYTSGDYVQGFLLKQIDEKKVILLDEAEDMEYTIFISDEKKERIAEKTAVKQEPAKPAAVTPKAKRAARRKMPRKPPVPPPNAEQAWQEKFERRNQ